MSIQRQIGQSCGWSGDPPLLIGIRSHGWRAQCHEAAPPTPNANQKRRVPRSPTALSNLPLNWHRMCLFIDVYCLFINIYACVLSHFSHVRLCVTLWTIALQAPLSTDLSRQEYWSRLPFPSPRDLPHPGIEPMSLTSPALAGRFFNL